MDDGAVTIVGHTHDKERQMTDSSRQGTLIHAPIAGVGVPAAPPAVWTPSRILTAGGAAGPPLFLALATLAGLLDPAYDARTQTVSDLAVGPLGWLQTANFYLLGASLVAFALALFRGLRRRSYAGTLTRCPCLGCASKFCVDWYVQPARWGDSGVSHVCRLRPRKTLTRTPLPRRV
jgi:Protein of unknown function (DUF998)